MTKLEILDTFLDINEDACKAVYNNDLKEIDMLMNNIYSSSLLHEDDYRLVLQAFRLANMPFSIGGYNRYNILPYEIRNAFWGDYKGYIEDLTIGIMNLNTFLNKYGYANEYEALNDSNNKRKIYNRTILKRIAMIDEYTTLYKKLVSLYDEKNITHIHKSKFSIESIQNEFISKVVDLVKLREKFYYYVNYDLVGYDIEDMNKILQGKKNNKERLDALQKLTNNIYAASNNQSINFRDYFIIKDNKKVTFTTYLKSKALTDTSWFDYKSTKSRKFVKDRDFYLQLAFFLGIPSSYEIENFLNFNGQSIKSPFKTYRDTNIFDYDICRWIDAGVDFNLINTMLGLQFL